MKNQILLLCLTLVFGPLVAQSPLSSPLKAFVEGRHEVPSVELLPQAKAEGLLVKKNEPAEVLSSILAERWDADEGLWEHNALSEAVYNGDVQMTSTHYYDWDFDPNAEEGAGETWVLDESIHFTYNDQNLIAARENETYDAVTQGQLPSARVEYDYEDFGEERETRYLRWDELLGQWEHYGKENRYYSAQELSLLESSAISSVTEEMQAYRQVHYLRDDQGRAIALELWNWEEETMQWRVSSRSLAVYENDLLVELQYYSLDEASQEFVLDAFETRSYDELGRWTTGIYYRVVPEGALPLGQIQLIYDEADHLMGEIYYSWYTPDEEEGGEATWSPTRSTLYSYNDDQQRSHLQTFRWLPASEQWLALYRLSYAYVATATLSFEQNTDVDLTLYPNPSSDFIAFRGQDKEAKFTLQLMDVNGKIWVVNNLGNEEALDVTHLQNGMYIYRISTESGVKTGKLLLR